MPDCDQVHEFSPKAIEFNDFFSLPGHKRGSLLYGPTGTGKTTLLCAYARPIIFGPRRSTSNRTHATWLDKEAIWTQASEYCRDVKDEINLSRRYEDWGAHFAASGIATTVKNLFIDDLGVEQATDYNADTICTLLDSRYRSRGSLRTFITTNLDLGEIAVRYGDRISSRLLEMCEVMHITGDDHRVSTAQPSVLSGSLLLF